MNPNVPNALTLFRVILIPVFAWQIYAQPYFNSIWLALIIFCVASFTDYLDGALARRHNIVSNFGKIMDPLADKLLVLTALASLCLLEPFRLSWIIFGIILIREVLITILREVYKKRGIIVAADKLGKIKTVMQMLGLIAAFFFWGANYTPTSVKLAISIWFWLVAAITVISGANYIFPKPGKR